MVSDLGGPNHCSEVKLHLVRRLAAIVVQAEAIEARLANGEAIDIAEHTALASTLVRLATRIGVTRVARDVTPNLKDYLAEHLDGEIA